MTIELTIDPVLEPLIAAETKQRGITVSQYVQEALIEKAQSKIRLPRGTMSIEAALDAMVYHGPISEEMKAQAITREFIYGDHP